MFFIRAKFSNIGALSVTDIVAISRKLLAGNYDISSYKNDPICGSACTSYLDEIETGGEYYYGSVTDVDGVPVLINDFYQAKIVTSSNGLLCGLSVAPLNGDYFFYVPNEDATIYTRVSGIGATVNKIGDLGVLSPHKLSMNSTIPYTEGSISFYMDQSFIAASVTSEISGGIYSQVHYNRDGRIYSLFDCTSFTVWSGSSSNRKITALGGSPVEESEQLTALVTTRGPVNTYDTSEINVTVGGGSQGIPDFVKDANGTSWIKPIFNFKVYDHSTETSINFSEEIGANLCSYFEPFEYAETITNMNNIFNVMGSLLFRYGFGETIRSLTSSGLISHKNFTIVSLGDVIYYLGGSTGGSYPSSALISYNTRTDTWSNLRFYPHPTSDAGAVALQGKLYVFGGKQLSSTTNYAVSDLNEYDPVLNSWQTLTPPPKSTYTWNNETRAYPIMGAVGDNIYIFGGEVYGAGVAGAPYARNHMSIYNIMTKTWRHIQPYSLQMNGCYGGTIGDKIYFFGGNTATANNVKGSLRSNLLVFDTTTETMSVLSTPVPARSMHNSAVVNGKLYITGGYLEMSTSVTNGLAAWDTSKIIYEYTPESNTWRTLTSIKQTFTTFPVALASCNNKIYYYTPVTGSNPNIMGVIS